MAVSTTPQIKASRKTPRKANEMMSSFGMPEDI